MNTTDIKPFDNCPALDGCHCVTMSLRKIYHHSNHPISEEMLLGLGAGMGFIYWQMKTETGNTVFIGGRGNMKDFFSDLGKRTGVKIATLSTASAKKAEALLLEKLAKKEPVMVYGDMGYLPWFEFPQDYHFGGHTFVVCGYDGKDTVLASDMEQKRSGFKKGFYYPMTLEQLRQARSSAYKPFPPKNTYLEFDFSKYRDPKPEDIYASIKQTVDMFLNPPIKNLGIKGIRHTAKEILKWHTIYKEADLRMNLFTLYIFIEIGGTGGGFFRYMYSRFLKESVAITKNDKLLKPSEKIQKAGEKYSIIGNMFVNALTDNDLKDRIKKASEIFQEIAGIEEEAYNELRHLG